MTGLVKSLAWMRDATTLFQLPHGLVAVAISLAALPALAQFFAAGNETDFRATLGRGLRMVLLLITPATIGLWVLGTPIVQLIFQRGAFMPSDTAAVVLALNLYLLGLILLVLSGGVAASLLAGRASRRAGGGSATPRGAVPPRPG